MQNLRYRVDYINYVLKLNVTSGQTFVYYSLFVRDGVFICLDDCPKYSSRLRERR